MMSNQQPTSSSITTLFAPLGLAYGSLYSALMLTRPQQVIVVTSQQAGQYLPLVVEAVKSTLPQLRVEQHTLSDPFSGFVEGRELAQRLAQQATEKNLACLTGGTTALQDTIRTIALLTVAQEFAVVDRRPVDLQRSQPLVVGELVPIPPVDTILAAANSG
jgi:hypothetical protein